MIFAAHITQYVDIVIAFAWGTAAAVYFVSTRKATTPVRRALRPLRLFGMCLAVAWVIRYAITFFGLIEIIGRPDLFHGVIDGLILITAVYFVMISLASSKVLNKLGVE